MEQHTDKSVQAEDTDVDFLTFNEIPETCESYNSFNDIDIESEDIDALKTVGINLFDNSLAGKFLMYGSKIYWLIPQISGIEIIPLKEAFKVYPEIKEKYHFRAIDKDQDKFTQLAYRREQNGYFIRVKKDVQVNVPLQTAMFMHRERSSMCVHNIVVLEEGASLHLITGCLSGASLSSGLHVTVAEYYIGKGAKFVSTMVHDWGPEFVVRPRTAAIVDDNATYVSNYYSLNPARSIHMNPFTHLKGKNANAKYMTILASFPNTYSDIGGTVLMEGEDSGAELVSRAVNHGGKVIQTGLLIGAAKGSRAHVDCSGLMMNDKGIIEAIPGLRAMHPDARMSHEAAIGRIDMGEVNYLQSKGLDEMQAIALIVRGFLDIGIEIDGLDFEFEKRIKEIAELSGHGEE